MNLREIGWEGVDWMHLAQEGDEWWVLMNTITFKNFWFHERKKTLLIS
jgi:hypothetical protein